MRAVIIWREESEYGTTVKEWLREFYRRTGKELESYSPDEAEGESLAHAYDLTDYPVIMIIDNDGKLLQGWSGMDPSLPRIDDVNGYMLEQ